MTRLTVAVVTRDPALRQRAAEAFVAAPVEWSVSLLEEAPPSADVVLAGPDVDIPGALALDPNDPLDSLASLRAVRRVRAVALVTAAAGGAGTTTVALHLARSLARQGPTCFLDLAGGAAARLGIGGDHLTWADVGGDDDIGLAALPAPGGFRALLSDGSEPAADRADSLLVAAERIFGSVVADVPASIATALPEDGRAAIVVVPATVVGARRSAALAQAVDRGRRLVIVNRTSPDSCARKAEVEKALGAPVGLELPYHSRMSSLADVAGYADGSLSRWGRRVDQLAHALRS